jgi:hypothetical protein
MTDARYAEVANLYQKLKENDMPMGTVFELSTLCYHEALVSPSFGERVQPRKKCGLATPIRNSDHAL